MTKSPTILTVALSALALAGAMVALDPLPAAAQTATKLDCKGCIKSKQIKDNKIKSKDIKDGDLKGKDLADEAVSRAKIADDAINSRKIADDAVSTAKIADGAVSESKLGSDVTALLGLSGVAVVQPADFRNEFPDFGLSGEIDPGIGLLIHNGDPGSACVIAPVPLPDGATITELELIFIDDLTSDFIVRLRRKGLTALTPTTLSFVDTNGTDTLAFTTLSGTPVTDPIVDAVDSFYYVDTCLVESGHAISAVRVFYQ